MIKSDLIKSLKNVEKIAAASKLRRMLSNPFKYFKAILHRELIYKRNKKEKEVQSQDLQNF